MSKTIIQRQFDGGMITDAREPKANGFRYATNFDTLTNAYKLTPFHDAESGDSAAATSQKQNFCVALGPAGVYYLFGLGISSNHPNVTRKAMTTGGSNDLSDAGWASIANNTGGGGFSSKIFTFYKTTGLIYGTNGSSVIWSFDPTGVAAWNDSEHSLSFTNTAEALVHSTNDIMYVPYDNKLAKNNAGSWSDAVLTLPSSLYITSICEYRTYIAIAAAPLSGVGSSRVYLWDMSATTWNDEIDFGEGLLKVIYSLNGTLVGISLVSGQQQLLDRTVFRYYTGVGSEHIATFQSPANQALLAQGKQRINNRLLFMATMDIGGLFHAGVWSIGRLDSGRFSVVHENTLNNDTALDGTETLNGFIKVGDYLFQSYSHGGTFVLTKTNDAASYTATSIMESAINPEMSPLDKVQKKQLVSVGAMYEPLPAAGQVVMKYRVDGGSWVTIFTETTDNAVSTEPYPIAGGVGKEFEFRVESTGGAEITGINYKYNVLASNV